MIEYRRSKWNDQLLWNPVGLLGRKTDFSFLITTMWISPCIFNVTVTAEKNISWINGQILTQFISYHSSLNSSVIMPWDKYILTAVVLSVVLNRPLSSCLLTLCYNEFHSYENVFPTTGSFSCKWKSFSYEKLCTKTRFETEAPGNLKMAYCSTIKRKRMSLLNKTNYWYQPVTPSVGSLTEAFNRQKKPAEQLPDVWLSPSFAQYSPGSQPLHSAWEPSCSVGPYVPFSHGIVTFVPRGQ